MRFLFERLAGDCDAGDPARAVLDNVQRLVSSRLLMSGDGAIVGPEAGISAGESLDVLRCGVPSIVEVVSGSRPGLERYGSHLRSLIAHYEPRLREPRVEVDDSLHLIVTGAIDTAEGPQSMRFPVELREDG